MSQLKFIADLHFGHKNILSYDFRPFKTIEEHDDHIVERWNNAVDIDDMVWILGDISWYNATRTTEIFSALNGKKSLCIGNHDQKLLKNKNVRDLFTEIVDYKELDIGDGRGLVLCHYPIPCYKNHFHGWYHFYGHVHDSFENKMMQRVQYEMRELYCKESNMFNVGCMIEGIDYTPRSIEEIIGGRK